MQMPLVTVVITTYNQEKYIANAIESVLAQKTDFPFELYISEDCGTDDTKAILQQYAAAHPAQIRLNLRTQNVGISQNWCEALCAAQGEFVCTLEGDDWWQDETKLQTQVDFLRQNPDYIAVSHTLQLTDDAGNTYETLPNDARIVGKEATMKLFLQGVTYSCTACLVRNIFKDFTPEEFRYVTANRNIADFALCMMYLDKGRVFVLPKAMSAYRVAGTSQNHQNYNATQSAVKKYADFLDVVLASRDFYGKQYNFVPFFLSGSFYPFLDRVRFGGLPAFLKQMRRLPLAAKVSFPFYLLGRCAGLLLRKIRRSQ